MGRMLPAPPKQNKNRLWDRYSKGEILKPTYNMLISNIPPPVPKHQIPRKIRENGSIDTSFLHIILILIVAIIVAGLFTYYN